ncbi:MAG: N-acetyltransferase [Bacteroidetes bacterium]|nr:MAG: N-acetyltransferase [Bacteroidota bacterium]
MNTTIPKSYQIETPRFRLRIPSEADIPFVFSASRYEGFNDGMLWEPPESIEELKAPLSRSISAWQKGEGFSFTVDDKKTNQPLGRISIRITKEPGRWNVGFWTHPESQGKGIMTECLKAVLAFGFEKLMAEKIEACHALWNVASEKVLKRNGMQFEKYLEKGFLKKGKWVPENLLVITRSEWEKIR